MLGVNLFNANQYKPFQPQYNPRQHSSSLTTTSSPDFHRRQFDPSARVQSVLNHRLSESLGPPDRAVSLHRHETAFDAETIANNILGLVQNRLKQAVSEGADQTELAALRERAITGIEQGIDEAKDDLEGLGALDDSVEAGIRRLRDHLLQGLEPASEDETGLEKAHLIEAMQGLSQSVETSFEMEIKTQDGDQVRLNFNRLETQQDYFSYQATADGGVLYAGHIESSMSRYALTVDGELDEDELTAIAGLAANIQQLSERFYEGDAQAAFEQGLQLGFDTEQIAGFAVDLQRSQTSTAVMRYQQISALDAGNSPKLPGLVQVRQLLGEITGILDQAAGLVESADEVTKDMLGGFMSRHPGAGDYAARLQGRHGGGLEKLAASLVDQVAQGSEADGTDTRDHD